MRFAFVSHVGDGLPLWLRVKDEGHDVMVYTPDTPSSYIHREVGRGLVRKASSIGELLAFGSADPATVYVFDLTHEGKTAEMLRRQGKLVVGGGLFCDRLEEDRNFGEAIAASVGMMIPESERFSTITSTIDFLKGRGAGRDWYFKMNGDIAISTTAHGEADKLIRRLESYRKRYKDAISNVLQETIDGTDISTAAWWNGRDWVWPYEGTVENKKFMAGDIGPATGCSMNVVWFYAEVPQIARDLRFVALGEVFRKCNAPPCIYDINAIISKKNRLPYFLEWTPRCGYDSEPTAQRALKGELAEFYYNLATGRAALAPFETDTAQMSVRVTVSPYPWEQVQQLPPDKRDKASGSIGVPVGGVNPNVLAELYGGDGNQFQAYGLGLDEDGLLIVTDPTGAVGLVCAEGTNLERMNDAILGFIEDDLDVPDAQYRNDAGDIMEKHLDRVRALGHGTGPL